MGGFRRSTLFTAGRIERSRSCCTVVVNDTVRFEYFLDHADLLFLREMASANIFRDDIRYGVDAVGEKFPLVHRRCAAQSFERLEAITSVQQEMSLADRRLQNECAHHLPISRLLL